MSLRFEIIVSEIKTFCPELDTEEIIEIISPPRLSSNELISKIKKLNPELSKNGLRKKIKSQERCLKKFIQLEFMDSL